MEGHFPVSIGEFSTSMQYRVHPLLASYVDFIWISEHYVQPHAKERVLPTGTMGLIVDLDGRGREASVDGARSKSFLLDTSKPLNVMGVSLKPGGGFPFFGPVVGELKDSSASLDALWGQQARDLREQVLEASTSAQRVTIVERHLLARLRRTRSIHPAVGHALSAFKDGRVSVSSVTNESKLNPRRFIELFRQEVGMTPKAFCRIARFKQALATVEVDPATDWTDIALRCGYYDQAHFNHDFREFAGVTPSTYLARRTSRHHVCVAE